MNPKKGTIIIKKFITIIILLAGAHAYSANLKVYRDTPLFCSKVEENKLPYGEYSLIRSYKNITQLVVSANSKIILYTDRDNQKDSEIFVTAFSRFEEVHLSVPSLQQHEFDLAVEKLIRKGDNSSSATIPFPGGDKFIEEIIKGVKPEKDYGEYFIYIKDDSKPVSLMSINLLWKKLTLRNILDENKIPSTFYSIYIDECYDKNIKKIIKEYAAVIKK